MPGARWVVGVITQFVLVMVLAAPAVANEQEWTYSTRQGDNLWVLATEYLVSMRYWGRFRALNDVPNPRHMQPGTKVRFPLDWLRRRAAPAQIVALSGQVSVQLAGQPSRPAKIGDSLHSKTQIETKAGSSAVIRFADDSSLLLRPRSRIVMDALGAYGRSGMVDSRARLQSGGIEATGPTQSPQRHRLEIITPSASAVVRGTRFRVSAEDGLGSNSSATTRTEVLEGLVRVANSSGGQNVRAGTGAVVRAGQAPGRPRKLLQAPNLESVPSLLERVQLRLRWKSEPAAKSYRVQIATVDSPAVLFSDLIVVAPKVTLADLPDGRYGLRVRAIDAVGLEGLQAHKAFELDARPEPPVTLEPRPSKTVRSLAPTFRWSEPLGAQAYRLQVSSDDSFAAVLVDELTTEPHKELTLAAGSFFWRIATVGAGDDRGPYGDIQQFTIRPAPPAPTAQIDVSDGTALLRWQSGSAGQTYEIELSDSEDFSQNRREEQTTQPQLSVPQLERDLFFRVRIVDTDGYRGPYGMTQRIRAPQSEPWWLLLAPILLLAL